MTNVDALFSPVSRGFYPFPNDQRTMTFVCHYRRPHTQNPSLSQYGRSHASPFVANRGLLRPAGARCRLMSPTVVFCLRPRNSFAFSNNHCDMRTPHVMMSISKSLPRNSGESPEHLAQQGSAAGLQTPTPDRIGPGVRMDAEGVMGTARP